MDTVFLLLLGISMLCIPVFIILAIINLVLRRPAKRRFAFAGISALVFVISIIGFGFTSDDPAPKNPVSVADEAPITTMEEPALTDAVDAIANQPASEPAKTSEATPSFSPETTVPGKVESVANENERVQQEEEQQMPPQEQAAQETTENQFTEEDTLLYSGDGHGSFYSCL